jgi:alkylation response protein AidB-like acyl-CoA dehydrogenase
VDYNLSDIQAQTRDTFGRFFAERSSSRLVRNAEPLGFDQALWSQLRDLGATTMGLPEDAGGDGAGLLDLTLVAEQQGRAIAPVPFIEVVVASRMLARHRNHVHDHDDLTGRLLRGGSLLTIALRPLKAGVSHLVPAGAVADAIIGLEDDELVVAEIETGAARRAPANVGSMPIADCRVVGTPTKLVGQPEAGRVFHHAVDEWKVLTAAALVGLSDRAHEMAVEFVRSRQIYGSTLGALQTVAHRLADNAVLVDGARFLSYKAAWAQDDARPESEALAAMSFLNAIEVANKVVSDSLHLHGGLGFTMEHDVQLYFRRAKAWPLIYRDPAQEALHLADCLYGKLGSH